MRLPTINCVHATTLTATSIACALGKYGGTPGPTVCVRFCADFTPRSPDASRIEFSEVETPATAPFDQWPVSAKAIAMLREDGDKGVGSTVARLTGRGGLAFKAAVKALGVDCGCDRRRDDWNARYPYGD